MRLLKELDPDATEERNSWQLKQDVINLGGLTIHDMKTFPAN